MAKKRLILVSSKAADQEFAKHLASRCQLDFQNLSSLRSSAEIDKILNGQDHIFIDAGLPNATDLLSSISSDLAARKRLHVIVSTNDRALVKQVLKLKTLTHLLYRSYTTLEDDTEIYERMIRSTELSNPSGLQDFLGKDTPVETIEFEDSLSKGFISNTIRFQLEQLGTNELIIPMISNAADEILMNAIYNAPVDSQGKRKHDQDAMKTSFKLEARDIVKLQVAATEKCFAICVIDQYGSLSPESIWKHVAKNFDEKQDDLGNSRESGAGIGLASIMKSGGSLYFIYQPGHRTEVIIYFKRTETRKEFIQQFQSVTIRTL